MSKKPTARDTKSDILSYLDEVEKQLKEEKSKKATPSVPSKVEVRQEKIEKVRNVSVDSIVKNLGTSKVDIMKVFEDLANQVMEKQEEYHAVIEAIQAAKEQLGDLAQYSKVIENLEYLETLKEQKEKELDEKLAETKAYYEKKQRELVEVHEEQIRQKQKRHDRELEEMNYNYGIKIRNAEQDHENKMEVLRTEVEALRTEKEEVEIIKAENAALPEKIAEAVKAAEGKKEGMLTSRFEQQMKMKEMETKNTLEMKELIISKQNEEIARLNKEVADLKTDKSDLTNKLQAVATSAIESKGQTPQLLSVTTDGKK